MTSDKSEYIQNWLFRANEDIAVMHSLTGTAISKAKLEKTVAILQHHP